MNIIGKRKIWLGFSAVLVVASIVAMIAFGFKTGVDFAGGTLIEIEVGDVGADVLPEGVSLESYLELTYAETTNEETVAQSSGVATTLINDETGDAINGGRWLFKSKTITNDLKNEWLVHVRETIPNISELRYETVSPTIGAEVVNKAIMAVIFAIIAILLYVAWSFRRVPRPTNSWQFSLAAIAALGHDVVILLGAYSVLGYLYGAEVDGMFIVALLTLLGFSVHDTIVTFDRLRENLIKRGGSEFEKTVNDSVVETVTRSINTSVTLIFVLLAMVLMGGSTITFFVLALLIGVIIGTYSSIFVAAPLLLLGKK